MNTEDFWGGRQRIWGLLARWMVLTLSVWAAAHVVSGVHYDDTASLLAAGLVLGLLNSLLKPLLVLVSIPFVVLSFGLFLVFINACLLLLSARLVKGFHVDGLWPAIGASLIISLIGMLLGASSPGRRRRVERRRPDEPTPIHRPPPGKGPIIDV